MNAASIQINNNTAVKPAPLHPHTQNSDVSQAAP